MGLALVLASLPLQANWLVDVGVPEAPGAVRGAAQSSSIDGDLISVYRVEDGSVRMRLDLRPGLLRMTTGACPSFRIDQDPAFSRGLGAQGCQGGARDREIPIARVERNRVDSPVLSRLLSGSAVYCVIPIEGAGYLEAEFSLRGSGEALREVLGPEVRLIER